MIQVNISNTDIALLNLIKESMFGVPFLGAQDVDWNKVLFEAQNQAVVGLIADSVTADNKDMWKKNAAGNTANSIRHLHAQRDLISLFQNHDIPLMILKGAAAAVYYPVPINRTMGDIDFIVPIDRIDEACKLMLENDYIQKKASCKI